MESEGVPAAQRGNRKGKRPGRRPRGVGLKERDGYWHAYGTLLAGGRSIRIRKSLGLAVAAVSQAEAEVELDAYLDDLKAKASGKVSRGDPVSIAAHAYLNRARDRPLAPTAINIVKEITVCFGRRRFNEIAPHEWTVWIDGETTNAGFAPGRMTGRSAATRERFLNGVFGFLHFARRHHGLAALPVFERDRRARNPNRRKRREVSDLRPDLVRLLFDSAHITIRAQLAVERCTGARVSSLLYAARVCDLILADKRAQITFPGTKNGEDVTAALDATAVAVLKQYLKWRGGLHRRTEPLFLTYRRKPYKFNGRKAGGQNKTGFRAAKRRAIETLRTRAKAEAERLQRLRRRKAAEEMLNRAEADAALLAKVTQHWFRHRIATILIRKDPRGAMEQGGWLDIRSAMGYAHDVPEHRHRLVADADDLGTLVTRGRTATAKKGQ